MAITSRLTAYEETPGLLFPSNVNIYFDNLVSLGLLECHDNHPLADMKKHYEPLFLKYAGIKNKASQEGHKGKRYPVHSPMGYYEITDYGKMLILACASDLREKNAEGGQSK